MDDKCVQESEIMKKDPIDIITEIEKKAQETALLYNNPYDNCMLCRYSTIQKNAVATMLRRFSFLSGIADSIDNSYPVVTCKLSSKYVPNPLAKPRWCKRK